MNLADTQQNMPDTVASRIQRLIDDDLTADELAALESELMESPEAMETYHDLLALHCALEEQIDSTQVVKIQSIVPIDRVLALQRKFVRKVSLLGAAAVILFTAVTMLYLQGPDHQYSLAKFQIAPGSNFTLTHSGEGDDPVGKTMIEGSRFVLHHGVAELNLPHDVRAVIEAPAEMVLRDDRTLELAHGRALFQVNSPDGQGFTVVTPHQRIVDLGTSFGIDFKKGGSEMELHVLEGRVRVDSKRGNNGEIIKAPRSVLLAGNQIQRELDGPPVAFLQNLPHKIDMLIKEDFDHGLILGHNYVIRMDRNLIRDLAGNRFSGIDDDTTWNFNTLRTTATVLPTSATWNYFHPLDAVDPAVADTDFNTTWHTQNDAGTGYDGPAFAGSGSGLFGYGSPGGIPTVNIGDPGSGKRYTAYFTTTFDLGAISASSVTGLTATIMADDGAFIYINGQLAANYHTLPGNDTYLAGTDGNGNIEVSTNITLDKSLLIDGVNSIAVSVHQKINDSSDLGFQMAVEATFEPISESAATSLLGLGNQTGFADDPGQLTPTPALNTHDDSPPFFIATYPADDSTNATQGGQMKMLFNEPIKFGSGRMLIQNVTDWSEETLYVGSSQLSIDDRVLSINPPTDPEDGAKRHGWLAGWESPAPVTFLNPRGDGKWYHNHDLQDDRRTRGMIESMHSKNMVSIHKAIRREIGTITAGSRYTISVAIGVRADDAKEKSIFPGYTIRLSSGDTVLAKLTSNTPPGPANSVNTVGLSWDATTLPDGVQPGDPLSIEITPNQTATPGGYLDLNALRISVRDHAGR